MGIDIGSVRQAADASLVNYCNANNLVENVDSYIFSGEVTFIDEINDTQSEHSNDSINDISTIATESSDETEADLIPVSNENLASLLVAKAALSSDKSSLVDLAISMNLDQEEREKLLSYLLDPNLSATIAETYLKIIDAGANPDKLKFLEDNKYLITSQNANNQDQLQKFLLDEDDLTSDDVLFTKTVLDLMNGGEEHKVEALCTMRDLNISDNDKNHILNLAIADKTVPPSLTERLVDALSSGSDIHSQDKILEYLRDTANLTINDNDFLDKLLSILESNDPERLNLLDKARVLDLSSEQEKKLLAYLGDPKTSNTFINCYLDLVTPEADVKKLDFLELNRDRISNLTKEQQEKFSEYLLDNEKLTTDDINFSEKFLEFTECNNTKAIELLDKARSKCLTKEQENGFIACLSMTDLNDSEHLSSLSEYLDGIKQSSTGTSYTSVLNILVKQNNKEKLNLLLNKNNYAKLSTEQKNTYFAYLADKDISSDVAENYRKLILAKAPQEKLDFIEANKYKISSLDKSLQIKALNYLSQSNEDISFSETYLRIARRGDLDKLDILDTNFKLGIKVPDSERFLSYFIDKQISTDFIKQYMELIKVNSDPSKLDFIDQSKYIINSLSKTTQDKLFKQILKLNSEETNSFFDSTETLNLSKIALLEQGLSKQITKEQEDRLLNCVLNKNISSDFTKAYVNILENGGDAGKESVLFDSLSIGLDRQRESRLLIYLNDKNISIDIAKNYLNLISSHAEQNKFTYLEDNKYQISSLSCENREKFFDYLIDQDDISNEDSVFAKTFLNLANQGNTKRINILSQVRDLDLSSSDEKQINKYLLCTELSSDVAFQYAKLSTDKNNKETLLALKSNLLSISNLEKTTQQQIASCIEKSYSSEDQKKILFLALSIIKDFELNKKQSLKLKNILESENACLELESFEHSLKRRNKATTIFTNNSEAKELTNKFKDITKLISNKFIDEFKNTSNVGISSLSQSIKQVMEERQKSDQETHLKQLDSLHSKLNFHQDLLTDEQSKGEKADQKKLDILCLRISDIEKSIKTIESKNINNNSSNNSENYFNEQLQRIQEKLLNINAL